MPAKHQRIFCVVITILLSACSQLNLQAGAGAEGMANGLISIDNSVLSETYVRPGMNLQNYPSIQLIFLGIDYRQVELNPNEGYLSLGRNEYPLTEAQKQKLQTMVADTFAEEFAAGKYFSVVAEPGPGVLLVRSGLTDVVSFVPPQRAGRGAVFLAELGQGTLVLEVDDSVTGQPLVSAVDRRRVETSREVMRYSNPVTNSQEVRRVVRQWARQLVAGLDELYEAGQIVEAGEGPLSN